MRSNCNRCGRAERCNSWKLAPASLKLDVEQLICMDTQLQIPTSDRVCSIEITFGYGHLSILRTRRSLTYCRAA